MKSVFLTSSPTGPLDGGRHVNGLDNMNGFIDLLSERWPDEARCLMISAFPDELEQTDEMCAFFHQSIVEAGLPVAEFVSLDRRNDDISPDELLSYNVILLGGGHVPTENAFFQQLGLKEMLEDFDGIIIGISAGSMNSADYVYAQPELEGEAVDPDYERWLRGLALTDINILPHYQAVKDVVLDGLALFDEITIPDSEDNCFLVLPDGSFLLIEDDTETVFGEAYMIYDGNFEQITEDGECKVI